MNAHELGRLLLAGPDDPVYVVNEDASAPDPVAKLTSMVAGEWVHSHTKQPLTEDAEGDPIPARYILVEAKDVW